LAGDVSSTTDAHLEVDAAAAALVAVGATRRPADGGAAAGAPATAGVRRRRHQHHHGQQQQPCSHTHRPPYVTHTLSASFGPRSAHTRQFSATEVSLLLVVVRRTPCRRTSDTTRTTDILRT